MNDRLINEMTDSYKHEDAARIHVIIFPRRQITMKDEKKSFFHKKQQHYLKEMQQKHFTQHNNTFEYR